MWQLQLLDFRSWYEQAVHESALYLYVRQLWSTCHHTRTNSLFPFAKCGNPTARTENHTHWSRGGVYDGNVSPRCRQQTREKVIKWIYNFKTRAICVFIFVQKKNKKLMVWCDDKHASFVICWLWLYCVCATSSSGKKCYEFLPEFIMWSG